MLKKTSKFIWTEEHENCFNEIKNRIANATANSHYNPQLETRVKCDASRSGLGAALEQLTVDGWKPIAFMSRFLNSCEENYIVNELEFLGVVWSIEYFQNYLYGRNFTVITDHCALLSITKENRSNKSYNSRLTRWTDRLLPFQFDIEHLPGAKMGFVDYISRHPSQKAKKVSAYDEEFIVAKLKLISTSINSLELNNTKSASHLHQLLIAHNPALHITPKIAANNKPINLINIHAARVYKHVYYNSPAPQMLASNSTCNLNNLKYVDPASQNTINTSLSQRNTSKRKQQLFQIRNELALAPRDPQIIQSKIPPIRRHALIIVKSHHPKIISVLFASSHPTIQSYNFNSKNSLSSKSLSEINYINKISNIMPSKKRITRVRLNDASRTAN